MAGFRYSRWDGTQVGFELGADDVFSEINDDLLYHGDLNAALRRLMQSGFRDGADQRVAGLRELLENLRRKRKEELQRHDLGGVYEDIAQRLREIVETERAAVDRAEDEARASDDRRRREVAEQAAAERRLQLDLLPPDLAGRVRQLEGYDFTSAEASEAFAQLVEELRRQLLQSYFNQMAGSMSVVSPAHLQRMKDMFNELNQLLEMRQQGLDTTSAFGEFMARFGDLFPPGPDGRPPQDLDALLEQLAGQMAAMQNMLDSMTPGQRAQLQGLAEQLLGDMDLRWQVERLGANLRAAFPQAGWDRRPHQFSGQDPLGLAEAASLMDRLGDMDQLENLLTSAPSPGALADVDIDRAADFLGEQGARSLARLADLARLLEEAGLIERREGRFELTPRGMRRIGANALEDLFSRLARDKVGRHEINPAGVGHERSYETKAYEFGDPFHLNIERTVRNALQRTGGGVPVRLSPDDFEVERTETLTRSATVLMLDLSLSMPMRDNFLAAKKVAMALHSLITTKFPRDFLGIVAFSEVARVLRPEQLPEVSWDYVYGTNMQHGFVLSRQLLARQTGTRQIIMITDGEPTAHLLPGGEVFFNYPPVPETVAATLGEVARCTREGIRINTFMLDATAYLKRFVEQLTRMNRGRAFFTTPETLGDFVLVDFISHRRPTGGAAAG